jgi:N-acetyl-gamma-glutamylphosphate reductase
MNYFVPNRGDFARGIFATLYTTVEESLEELVTKYETFIKISLCNGNTTNQYETSSTNQQMYY